MDKRREATADVLEGILALLVSFAGLADRAAGLPLSIALPAMAFLTQSEAVARAFVIDLPAGAPALVMGSQEADRADRLAADFRALARLLRALLARLRRRAWLCARDARPSMPPDMASPGGRRVPALTAPDSS